MWRCESWWGGGTGSSWSQGSGGAGGMSTHTRCAPGSAWVLGRWRLMDKQRSHSAGCCLGPQCAGHGGRGLGEPSAAPSLHSPWTPEQLAEPRQGWALDTWLQWMGFLGVAHSHLRVPCAAPGWALLRTKCTGGPVGQGWLEVGCLGSTVQFWDQPLPQVSMGASCPPYSPPFVLFI